MTVFRKEMIKIEELLSSLTHDSGTDRDGLHSNCDGLIDLIEKCTLSPSPDLMTSFTIQWTTQERLLFCSMVGSMTVRATAAVELSRHPDNCLGIK